jgi:hypothetical protein
MFELPSVRLQLARENTGEFCNAYLQFQTNAR